MAMKGLCCGAVAVLALFVATPADAGGWWWNGTQWCPPGAVQYYHQPRAYYGPPVQQGWWVERREWRHGWRGPWGHPHWRDWQ